MEKNPRIAPGLLASEKVERVESHLEVIDPYGGIPTAGQLRAGLGSP